MCTLVPVPSNHLHEKYPHLPKSVHVNWNATRLIPPPFGLLVYLVRVFDQFLLGSGEGWPGKSALLSETLDGWEGDMWRAPVCRSAGSTSPFVCLCPSPFKLQSFVENSTGHGQSTSPDLFFNIGCIVAQPRSIQGPRHKSLGSNSKPGDSACSSS